MLDSALTSAGMTGLFDHVLSVDAVRVFKTASQAYALGPAAFGASVEEIVFVSSNGWDVCGATWYGYTTFWVNRAGLPPEELGVSPHAAGRGLDELSRFIAQLGHAA
jgi:2-haloacid dehalogenase